MLLYELLTGSTPLDAKRLRSAGYGEMIRLIKEEEPLKPSTRLSQSKETLASLAAHRCTNPTTLVREVRVELDWIVMKCLEKDRGRRYDSASNLARDVERYLHDEPVEACPPSTAYRLSKLWRKHRLPLIAAGLILLALVSGIIGTTWGLLQASGARRVAQEKAQDAITAAQLEGRAKQAEADARQKAENERDAKNQALIRAEGLRLTAQSELVRPSNPGRALLLAIEGAQRTPGLLANNALVSALDECAEVRTFMGHEGDVHGVTFSPDNKSVLSWSADQTARIWDIESGRQVRRLDHKAQVGFASFSPNGKRILTIAAQTGIGGPGGKTVHIWDSVSGRQISTWTVGDQNKFDGMWFPVASPASFSPDSQRVAVTCRLYPNDPPAIYQVETGKREAVLRGHQGPVLAVHFSPDGQKIVTAALDRTAGVWEAATGKLLHSLTGHKGGITSATFSPDGQKILTCGDGNEHEFSSSGGHSSSVNTATQEEVAGRIWDVATGKELVALQWPAGQKLFVRSARFNNDGAKVITAGYTGFPIPISIDEKGRLPVSFPRVWDAATGKLVQSFDWTSRDPLNYTAAEFSPDARMVLAIVNGKSIQLGDATTGTALFTYRGHDENVVSAAFSPDSKRFATVAADRTIRIWDASFAAKSAPQHLRWNDTWRTTLLPDGRHMLAHHHEDSLHGSLRLWEIASGQEVWRIQSQPHPQEDPMLSADSERFAVRYLNSVAVYETRTGKELFALDSRQGLGGAAAFSPDGKRLVFKLDLAKEKGAHIWDVDAKTKLFTLEGDTTQVRRIEFSPDGRGLLTTDYGYPRAGVGHRTTLARIFNADTGKRTGELSKEFRNPRVLADHSPMATFSRDGRRILTAFGNEAILWDARTCENRIVFNGHADAVLFAAISPDEKRVVTTSRDRTARLWDADTGKELHVFKGREGDVGGAVFSPNGTRIATWEKNSTIRLWDTDLGKELITWPSGSTGSDVSARFSFDGQWLLIRSGSSIRFRPLDLVPVAMRRRPRELTAQEREQYEIPSPEPPI